MKSRKSRRELEPVNFDLSISDLMAALVMIFILTLSVMFIKLKEQTEVVVKQSQVAAEFREKQMALVAALREEFKDDLEDWGAEIDDKTLVIRFKEEDRDGNKISFEPDSAIVGTTFQDTLNDFFPRYISVLIKEEFRNDIEEIRIEGHTANPDGRYSNPKGYSNSIRLSQNRANNVLFHVVETSLRASDPIEWVRTHIAASGFAYAKPLLNSDGKADWTRSRRVEFRIRTNYEEVIDELVTIGRTGAGDAGD